MTDKQKIKVYEHALINIFKRAGVCWDGERKCMDQSFVASVALKKANKRLYMEIDDLHYEKVKVFRNGSVKIVKG